MVCATPAVNTYEQHCVDAGFPKAVWEFSPSVTLENVNLNIVCALQETNIVLHLVVHMANISTHASTLDVKGQSS